MKTITVVLDDEYTVEIEPKVSIVIIAKKKLYNRNEVSEQTFRQIFKIDDYAEYDSYNLSYIGTIESITEKTVTIKEQYSQRKRRLKLSEFSWRNWDFDVNKARQKNAEWSD